MFLGILAVGALWLDKAIGREADEILAMCADEGFSHLGGIFSPVELKKSALFRLFLVGGGRVYLFTSEGIDTRVIHDR